MTRGGSFCNGRRTGGVGDEETTADEATRRRLVSERSRGNRRSGRGWGRWQRDDVRQIRSGVSKGAQAHDIAVRRGDWALQGAVQIGWEAKTEARADWHTTVRGEGAAYV
jgi:hypothetical protein